MFLSEDDAALGAAQELVSGKTDHVHVLPQAGPGYVACVHAHRFRREQETGALIVQDEPAAFMGDPGQLPCGDRLGKAVDNKVAGIDFQKDFGTLLIHGPLIVPDMGFVGTADLAHLRAAGVHDFRDPEGTADLHQFAAGDGHGFPLCQRVEH